MSVFTVLNTGTCTLLKNNPTKDASGGPVAAYEVVQADIPCQREGHRNKLLGNEMMSYDQPVIRGQYDVWLDGQFPAVRAVRGNGYAVRFDDGEFGRVLDCEPDFELGGMPDSLMLTVEIIGS